MTRIGRREFLGKATFATAAGAGALAACSGPAEGPGGSGPAVVDLPRLNWRLASSFPRGLDTIYGAAETLAERVESLSEGRFRIRPYPAGELVPGLGVLDAVQQGTVELGHTASYYYTGKNPAVAFDTAMPFGLNARQQNAWLYHGGGQELMREVFADFSIVHFPAGNTGSQMGGWFRREVNTLEELRGLKMRIPGLGAEVLSRLGVTVQTIPGGEIYPALERGVVDAAEWVGPYDDEKLGFQRVAKNYYYPGWWEPGPTLSVYVNQAAWDSLPSTYQEIFQSAAAEANVDTMARYDSVNLDALTRLVEGGVSLRPFSEEILEACRTAAFDLMNENASADPAYRKIFEHWNAFRESSFRWFSTSEQAYAQFSFPSA